LGHVFGGFIGVWKFQGSVVNAVVILELDLQNELAGLFDIELKFQI
jgi:hypothetical protein